MINILKIKSIRSLALVFLFSIFGLVLSSSLVRAQEAVLSAPTISVAPDTYYPFDETLYIEGHALPKSKVALYFEKTGSQPIRISVDANSNGEWYFTQKLQLVSGEWMLRARVDSDPPSDWSNPRIIVSVVSGFAIGPLKIKYLPVVFGLSAFFLVGLIIFFYSVFRVRTIKRMEYEQKTRAEKESLEKQLREKDKEVAAVLVETEFAELRRNLTEELSHFDQKTNLGEQLTKEEIERHARLLRELNEVEATIEKKLKNVV
jgi:hypothetical protein